MKSQISGILVFSALMAGCWSASGPANTEPPAAPAPAASTAAASPAPTAEPGPPVDSGVAGSRCFDAKLDGMRLIRSQTFAFDHKPFEGSCFVTFGNVDEMLDAKDLPRGSRFHIFKDGKSVYEFPDAFGGQSSCWVTAIGFADLNADRLTDVVMAGKCLGAKDSYPANAIFVNTGSAFATSEEANAELDELETVDEIRGYAKKNVARFF